MLENCRANPGVVADTAVASVAHGHQGVSQGLCLLGLLHVCSTSLLIPPQAVASATVLVSRDPCSLLHPAGLDPVPSPGAPGDHRRAVLARLPGAGVRVGAFVREAPGGQQPSNAVVTDVGPKHQRTWPECKALAAPCKDVQFDC